MKKQQSNFTFPISLEMQEFIKEVDKFSEDYNKYINESKFSIESNSSEDEIAIQNMRLMYLHMRIENDKLKELIDQTKYHSFDRRWITYGPTPLHATDEYPMYQTFNNFSSTIP